MVLVFAETPQGKLKKTAFEAVTYGKKTATLLGTSCTVLTLGDNISDAAQLGSYGADRILSLPDADLNHLDGQMTTSVIASVAKQLGDGIVIRRFVRFQVGESLAG